VFKFFYIVVSVFPSNDSCSSAQVAERGQLLSVERVDNFDPILAQGPVLLKNINITIDAAFPGKLRIVKWVLALQIIHGNL